MAGNQVRTAAAASTAGTMNSSASAQVGQGNVVQLLRERGLLQDMTGNGLEKLVSEKEVSVYCGFDPTAESLHLGNLLGIIVLSWFQRCGHTPVALVGGATGRVGDPSGKSAERPVLSEETIEGNVRGIGSVLERLLQDGESGPIMVNNLSWYSEMNLLTFLRDVGKFARVGTMLSKDCVKTRLESETGISFTEFTYQLLQGYDFVYLLRNHGVQVQIGGSDQWGNITAGTELARKILGGEEDDASPHECYGLTFPLLLDSSGKKFGKSEGGAMWLNADKLSPYKFYQYLFATTDADVVKFLKMLTFVPLKEIAAIEASMGADDYIPNTAQWRLAEEVTRFVHGERGLQVAIKATEGLAPGSNTKLDSETLEAIADDIPNAILAKAEVLDKPLVDVMVAAGLQKSKSEARRTIKGGGCRVNNNKVKSEDRVLSTEDLLGGRLVLLASGKKNKMLVRVK